ncbi:MAG: FAD-dependent oxidoreductase [Candidatus Nanoarchaeia archaeon]|nr:FAD-dependent oxidoreductase [Candidatus Nanoarchaeia archaeon]
MHDAIIIGMGPAGLSAAMYLARANKKVLVIGELNKIWKKEVIVNNYFGTGEITGEKLMEKGLAQAKEFGAEIIKGLVTKIEISEKGFFKCLANGLEHIGKKLLIATGSALPKKEVINQDEFIGKGVSFCVPCDGFFFKDKKVAVIGSEGYALVEAIDLLNYTKNIILITNGKKIGFGKEELKKNNIILKEEKIEKILGEKKVEALKTNKGIIAVDGVFIASGAADSNDFAKMIGVVVENNKVVVDSNMKTNLPGIFAAGDCVKGIAQISKAVYEGFVAAISIIGELKE